MAYDRYDRDERSRWSDDRTERGWRGDNRGGPRRARLLGPGERRGRSWFGDDDAERRRRHDTRRDERMGDTDRGNWRGQGRDQDYGATDVAPSLAAAAPIATSTMTATGSGPERAGRQVPLHHRGGLGDRDTNRNWRGEPSGGGRELERNRGGDRGYRPMTGDYGRGDSP